MNVKRRQFLIQLGSALATPWAAQAQTETRIRRLGIITPFASTDADTVNHLKIFREELGRLGWHEGREIAFDYRWGDGDPGLTRSRAKELVEMKPDLILCRATPTARAVAENTQTIPIIFVVVSDPVGDKLVDSIARPGRNLTGFTNVEASLGGKWLGLLRDIVPPLKQVAVMFSPQASPGGGRYYMQLIDTTAKSSAIRVLAMPVQDVDAIRHSVDEFASQPGSGMVVLPDVLTTAHRKLIVESAAQRKLPTIFAYRYIVAEGGLASYGVDVGDLYRRAAGYADRILRGDKVGELPVQAPVKFELAINLKTAQSLGLTIPPTLLATADSVVE
jgi:ABC-type uncharacterized transport system substrate-binding protein